MHADYPSEYTWSLIALFILYLVLIIPKEVAQPVLSIATGLSPYEETNLWIR